jgi:hypothetical protein
LISVAEGNTFTAAEQRQGRENIGCSIGIPDVIIEDQKASGTYGGSATSGAWRTRDLNALVRNAGAIASLSSNQITLGAGTYFLKWTAPAFGVDRHQTRLRNISDSTTPGHGTSEYTGIAGVSDFNQTHSAGSVVVTIAGSKVFELQQQVTTTRAATGFGVAAIFSGNTEVYSRVEITKLS